MRHLIGKSGAVFVCGKARWGVIDLKDAETGYYDGQSTRNEKKMKWYKSGWPVLPGTLLFGAMLRLRHASEVKVAVVKDFFAPAQQIVELFRQESGRTIKLSFGHEL